MSTLEFPRNHISGQSDCAGNTKSESRQQSLPISLAHLAVQDCALLSVVVVLSFAFYVRGLGFYTDDWLFFGLMNNSDGSIGGMLRALSVELRMRPVQMLYLAILHRVFGLEPFGYHLVNMTVILITAALFYFTLLEFKLSRVVALSVPLIYALLPHYATDRFWLAAFQANLSITLYLLSFYCDLKAVRAASARFWVWKLIGLVSLLGSGLAYEVALPLFLLNPVLIWFYAQKKIDLSITMNTAKWSGLLSGNVVGVVFVLGYKALTTIRLGHQLSFADRLSKFVMAAGLLLVFYTLPFILWRYLSKSRQAIISRWMSRAMWLGLGVSSLAVVMLVTVSKLLNAFEIFQENKIASRLHKTTSMIERAATLNLVEYGIGSPRILWSVLTDLYNGASLFVAVMIGLIVFSYLCRVTDFAEAKFLMLAGWLKLTALGFLVFGLGYALFIATGFDPGFTLSGMNNRTSVAAAMGVALAFVGVIGMISRLIPSAAWRRFSFSLVVALVCSSGALINNALASFWVNAYAQQKEVIANVQTNVPNLPAGSTLILDGLCAYTGPAPIFECYWDVAGMLKVYRQDATLKGDIVTSRLKVNDAGIATSIYDDRQLYPYSDNLYLFNVRRKALHSLTNSEEARRYIQSDSRKDCISAEEGYGIPVFRK